MTDNSDEHAPKDAPLPEPEASLESWAASRSKSETPSPEDPSAELRRAMDHLGRAALAFKERYLSDEKLDQAAARARATTEVVADEVERAARTAGGAIDTLATDAERTLERSAVQAEERLRELQRSAEPALQRGLARLTSLWTGSKPPDGDR